MSDCPCDCPRMPIQCSSTTMVATPSKAATSWIKRLRICSTNGVPVPSVPKGRPLFRRGPSLPQAAPVLYFTSKEASERPAAALDPLPLERGWPAQPQSPSRVPSRGMAGLGCRGDLRQAAPSCSAQRRPAAGRPRAARRRGRRCWASWGTPFIQSGFQRDTRFCRASADL